MTGKYACGWGAHRKWFQTMASPGKSPVIVYGLSDELRFGSALRPGRWRMAFWWQSSAAASGSHVDLLRTKLPTSELTERGVLFAYHAKMWKIAPASAVETCFFQAPGKSLEWTQRLHHSWRPLGFTKWWIAHAHMISHWRIKHGES